MDSEGPRIRSVAAMPTGAVLRPWQKYLRFSVRGLIVLVLAIGAGLGSIVRGARIQREAAAAIRNADGMVYYDWQSTPAPGTLPGKPPVPRWLVELIGVDYFGHIRAVSLHKATDATMAQVGQLNRLDTVLLRASSVSDTGLAHLSGVANLSILDLSHTQVTRAGLAHLKDLNKLGVLDLAGAQVTDDGLAHLKGLSNLMQLNLNSTHVTDAGLVHLKGLAKLHVLEVVDTQVTEEGAKELGQALPLLMSDR